MANTFMGVDTKDPKAVISKVFKDLIKNSILFGVAALVAVFIMNVLHWKVAGFVLAIIICIPIAINIVKYVLIDLILTIVATAVLIYEKVTRKAAPDATSSYFMSLLGNLIQLAENTIGLLIFAYLYHAYYKKDFIGILHFFGLLS
ncbi:hypothetical protein [Paenibacillus sp. MMO-58]|uniref:hypothetical protein n=1 Tax=Paenibacillus sp. MMO-58 TaxID=3081290 RepID=UPI00301A437C